MIDFGMERELSIKGIGDWLMVRRSREIHTGGGREVTIVVADSIHFHSIRLGGNDP